MIIINNNNKNNNNNNNNHHHNHHHHHAFHCITGCDSVSSFHDKSKTKACKLMAEITVQSHIPATS